MSELKRTVLILLVIMAGTGNSTGEEQGYKRDIRHLRATILDLRGLPSSLNQSISDLSVRADELTAQHSSLSVRQDKTAVRVSMMGDVLFDFDKAKIQTAAEPTLVEIARLITSITGGKIVIEGHTDAKGPVSNNQNLSFKRANAVATWLAANGVDKARLSVKGLGSSRPVAPNTLDNGDDNPDGRALNRRVEFVLPMKAKD